ncbi:MAG TPA: hypothetical protein VGO13_02625 [Solirubrobacterales bacterium]|jgi:hypothetical protein|nr:hypothetical protein [Solirubrobacterales bacterium]
MALCAVAIGLSSGSSVRAAPALLRSDYFGMNAQYVFKLPPEQWDRQLAAIAATGVGVVREDAFWSRAERRAPSRGAHSYDWHSADAIATALARNGLRWYPILDYSTPWAGTLGGARGWKSAPIDPDEFAAYAAAFAARYGSGGSFWTANPSLPALPVQTYEIWNEPNLTDFWTDTSGAASRYGDLLAATAPAIRAADPDGSVVVGGLSPTGLIDFLNGVEARQPGLIAEMDAVAFHPYGTTFANTGARVRVLREWLDQHGAATLPIEVTETGWATPPLPEADRATRMANLVRGLTQSSCGITRIIPYTWMTFESEESNPEEWFGIAHEDGSLKPTGIALTAAMASVLTGATIPASDPCAGLDGGVRGPSFPEIGLGDLPEPESGSQPEPAPEPQPELEPEPVVTESHTTPAETDPGALPEPSSMTASHADPAPPSVETAAASVIDGQAAIAVRKRRHAVAVQVTCPRACTAIVRVRRAGGKAIAKSVSPHLSHRYRALLNLPASTRGAVTVRAIVETPGAEPQLLVRKLH